MALEITADLDPGALKTAIPLAGALMNLQISVYRHIAFEQHGFTVIGLDIAADRGRLLVGLYDQARALRNVYVPGDSCDFNGAGCALGHDDVIVDGSRQGAGTIRVGANR